MSTLQVTIAGVTVALTLPHAGWAPPLQPRLGKFLTGQPAELALRVVLSGELNRAPGGEPRVEEDPSGLWLRHDNFEGHLPPAGPATLTIFQAGDAPDDLTYTMVVDSLLRLMLAQALLARGAVMLHAAGIATAPEAGYVFFGPSGAGKTTVCKLSHPRYQILCDEVVALTPAPEGYLVHGTPFCGAWGDSEPFSAPLREVFLLRQAHETRRLPLAPAAALRALLECAVAYHRSPERIGALMDVLLELIARVPVNGLAFEPKESLWETVLSPTPAR